MTRIRVSIMILFILAAMAAWSGVWICGRCSSLVSGLDRTEALLCAGMTEEAEESAYALGREWKELRRCASVLVRGCRLYDLDRGYAGLGARMTGDRREALACAEELRQMTVQLAEGEIPKLRSVF
ncbi:MAG: DUF4363 family protein [Ruminococcus sp.]|nr:DUF4363 family protein [Ruminococcus sp.]